MAHNHHCHLVQPSQFDHPPQPLYQTDSYNRQTIPRETACEKEIHAKLDYLLAVFDKWDATDRRIGRLYAPPRSEPTPNRGEHRSAGQPWRDPSPLPRADRPTPPRRPNAGYQGSFHDQPHPRTIANNWDQVGWDDHRDHRQRQGFEEYPRRHQHLHNSHAEQPTYRSDRLPSHGTAPLPAGAPTPSDFTHRPRQSSKFINSGKQRGLPNTPNLMVRSPCPAQLAPVSDYNDNLRIYRLEQDALLARVNALFEESIDDKNLAEDVPDNVAHNGGVGLEGPNVESLQEVPSDKSLEEIVKPNDVSQEEVVKMDNMPPQVLVGVYDENIGELIVPTHRELKMKDDVETWLEENVVGYEDIMILTGGLSSRNNGASKINSKSSRSHVMFIDKIESWCQSSVQGLIYTYYHQRLFTFDPGGEAFAIGYLHCIVLTVDFNRGGVDTILYLII